MFENLAPALGWGIAAIAFFTFLSVAAWSSARQAEREAYYKSEAIKKMAEIQGATPEPVLQLLREAVATWRAPGAQSVAALLGGKGFHRAEIIKKMAETQGAGADAILAMFREEDRANARRVREGLKLGGLICCAAGIGLLVSLRALVTDEPVYLVGLIPILVGITLLAFGYVSSPKD